MCRILPKKEWWFSAFVELQIFGSWADSCVKDWQWQREALLSSSARHLARGTFSTNLAANVDSFTGFLSVAVLLLNESSVNDSRPGSKRLEIIESLSLLHIRAFNSTGLVFLVLLTTQMMLQAFRQIFTSPIEKTERECGKNEQWHENNGHDDHKPRLIENISTVNRLVRRDAAGMCTRRCYQVSWVHNERHLGGEARGFFLFQLKLHRLLKLNERGEKAAAENPISLYGYGWPENDMKF